MIAASKLGSPTNRPGQLPRHPVVQIADVPTRAGPWNSASTHPVIPNPADNESVNETPRTYFHKCWVDEQLTTLEAKVLLSSYRAGVWPGRCVCLLRYS